MKHRSARADKGLIQRRQSADERTRQVLTVNERATLIRLLKLIAEMEF